MAYQTLYRKWRPQTFDDVVGQEHITNTLKNEIISGKIAHAYMFTGTRGTGKTSTAKILSRAINCENNQNGNPCNQCYACRGIINESILDVVEMDAASNNSVENIREIIDQVRYSTASTKYKVYIIDEVHMLSMGAFNALLKTLEEPPAHVIFILATTEIHKVPATILSRCQRFDFKNITSSAIAGAVAAILKAEGISATNDAVEYIAYLGGGSMRDALSITEQCLAYKANDISYEDVTEILGTLDDEFLYTAAMHIANSDTRELMLLFNDCVNGGKNPDSFVEGLVKAMRDILLYLMAPEICDFTVKKRDLVDRAALLYNKDKLVRCIDILSIALRDIKLTSNTRVMAECVLIRLANPSYDSDITSLADRISTLEGKLERGSFCVSEAHTKQNESAQGTIAANIPAKPKKADAPSKPSQSSAKDTANTKDTANANVESVVNEWETVKKSLEEKGRLVSFVSLYGINPRAEGDSIILPFESAEAVKNFKSGSAIEDVQSVVAEKFGFTPSIKCVVEAYDAGLETDNNDIFKNLEKISNNFPENFKID